MDGILQNGLEFKSQSSHSLTKKINNFAKYVETFL